MKNKILVIIISLIVFIVFSCEDPQLVRSDQAVPNSLSGQSVNGLFPNCPKADAVVRKLVVTNVSGNNFDFTFSVFNQGQAPLLLNRMMFQPYLSEDAVLDANDVPFRGAIFGDTAPTLAFGEHYEQNWFFAPQVPINLMKLNYLIVKVAVKPLAAPVQECSLVNNVAAAEIGCVLSEAIITDVTFTSVDLLANSLEYTFTVTNTGWTPLPLSQMSFQTYVSEDDVLDLTEGGAAGGASLGFPSGIAPALSKGESYTQAFYYHPSNPEDLTQFKYLLIQIMGSTITGTVPECDFDNNVTATLINIDIPRNGLVAFYPFNTNAQDVSGNNLHGTPIGPTLATDRFGNSDHAFSFDGINDYITAGNPPQLQFTGSITLSFWVKGAAFTEFANIISKKQDVNESGSLKQGYWITTASNTEGFHIGAGMGNPGGVGYVGVNHGYAAPFVLNEWANFTFTLEGQNATWYKNGVVTFSSDNHTKLLAASLGDFTIGRWTSGGFYFNGLIDDVAVYNRALSATEVQQLYGQTISN